MLALASCTSRHFSIRWLSESAHRPSASARASVGTAKSWLLIRTCVTFSRCRAFPNCLNLLLRCQHLERRRPGASRPLWDGVAESRVATLAVLPWASRSIFLGPGKGDFPILVPKTGPKSLLLSPAALPPHGIHIPKLLLLGSCTLSPG